MLILEPLALVDSIFAIRIDSAEPTIAKLHLIGAEYWALSGLAKLDGMVDRHCQFADEDCTGCPSEALQSRVRPVFRCWAEEAAD
jgi:hypothetical protein